MRTIIAGTREIADKDLVFQQLDEYQATTDKPISLVISGHARGIDKIGEEWGEFYGLPIERYPAYWDLHGKKAGFLRNREMANVAEAAVLFWDGESRGTRSMLKLSLERSLHTVLYIVINGIVHHIKDPRSAL